MAVSGLRSTARMDRHTGRRSQTADRRTASGPAAISRNSNEIAYGESMLLGRQSRRGEAMSKDLTGDRDGMGLLLVQLVRPN
ncbi:hypothetical protein VTI28DRAFT_5491 [Corynascus sepedonium]